MSLSKKIDLERVFALNQDNAHPVANIFLFEDHFYLKSDADDQLIINIPFKSKVVSRLIEIMTTLSLGFKRVSIDV